MTPHESEELNNSKGSLERSIQELRNILQERSNAGEYAYVDVHFRILISAFRGPRSTPPKSLVNNFTCPRCKKLITYQLSVR